MQQEKETYNKIIQAGREILNKKDYHETVVEEIAQLAGVAKGTVFFYFKSKENLFREIMLSLIDELKVMIEKIVNSQQHPLKKLKEIYDNFVEFQLNNMHLFLSLRKELSHTEPKICEVKERLEEISRIILPLVDEMSQRRLIKKFTLQDIDLEVVSSMVLMYASAVSSMVFFYKEKIHQIKEIFWNVLLHGILNEDVSIEMLLFDRKF
jgi:AcrR family transcriptional regulator